MLSEIKYSEVQKSLKIGDLVLFHGIETVSRLSELVAKSLMAVGLLSEHYVANGYCPEDFIQFKDMPVFVPIFFFDGVCQK